VSSTSRANGLEAIQHRDYPPRVLAFAPFHFMVLLVAGWLNRHQMQAIVYLRAENRVLRDRMHERRHRFTDSERRTLALAGEPVGRAALRDLATLASPETVLRGYRDLVAKKYAPTRRNAPSTPPTRSSVEADVLRMARGTPSLGYTRIRGALRTLGIDAGRSTIARILKANGLEPAPERGRVPSWRTFLDAHRGAIAAADFFTVEALTMRGQGVCACPAGHRGDQVPLAEVDEADLDVFFLAREALVLAVRAEARRAVVALGLPIRRIGDGFRELTGALVEHNPCASERVVEDQEHFLDSGLRRPPLE
jgi:hypothetical protein